MDDDRKKIDLTTDKPLKAIIFFTMPILISLVIQQLYSLADVLIVGNFLGVEALAAIGCTQGIYFLIFISISGLPFGVVTSLEHNFGSKNYENVKSCAAICVVITFVLSAIVTIFSTVFCRDLIILVNTPENLIDNAYTYLIINMYGIEAYSFFLLLSNMMRSVGNSKIPTIIQTITVVLNILLDIVAVVILKLAIMGAALATVISWIIGTMVCVFYIKRDFKVLHFERKHFHFGRKIFIEHLVNGTAVAFQMAILSIGMIVRQIALNNIGSVAIASFVATNRIEALSTMPMTAFGVAIKTYVAQNYGAKKFDRIIKGVKQVCIISVTSSIAIALFNIFFGEKIVSIFVGKYQTQIIEYARIFFITSCSFYWALNLLLIARAALQGMSKVLFPTLSSVIELFMRILVVLLLVDILGYNGVCMADPAAWLGAFLINFIAFIFTVRKWKRNILPLKPSECPDNVVK